MIRSRARFDHALDTRWVRGVRLVSGLIVAAAVALLCAGTASASCGDVYDGTFLGTGASPADGAAFQAIGGDLATNPSPPTFSVQTPYHGVFIWVEVATQNVPGRDGTLSDEYMTDFFSLDESSAVPGLYSTTPTAGSWMDTPGTYYWQMHALTFDRQGNCQAVKSPVYTLTVTATPPPVPPATITASPPQTTTTAPLPPLPRLTLVNARSYAASMVRQHTHRTPHVNVPCSRVDAWTLHCSPSWIAGGSSYRATGEFETFRSGGAVDWAYDFSGTQTWRTCARRHGASRCTTHRQHFHWQ
jgi:hypothetical protein